MTSEHKDSSTSADERAPASEDRDLAQEVGLSFGQLVAGYVEHFGLTPEEARARVLDTAGQVDRIQSSPPDQVSWMDLHTLERDTPGEGQAKWEAMKAAARGELRNGHRAARVLEGAENRCWDRARFLALRGELVDSVRPRTAIEVMLVDQLALWQSQLLEWQETVATYSALQGGRSARRRGGIPELPRLSDAEAIDRAMRTVERLHRLYHQTLKTLQALGRAPSLDNLQRHGEADQCHLQLKVFA
jgi:hypothetical protein